MKDALGRTTDYTRISIADRCNLHCKYCTSYGAECVPRWDVLSLEEIQAVGICAADLGIRHIKMTEGEPLVRRDCCQLAKRPKSMPGVEKVIIIASGVLLERYLDDLAKVGIDGINISLSTLDRDLHQRITGTDTLGTVIEATRRTCAMPVSVETNVVFVDFSQMNRRQREAGRNGWRQMVELAKEYPVGVRFTRIMPIGYGKNFRTTNHQELLEGMIRAYPGMEEDDKIHGFGSVVHYRTPGFKGGIGLISVIHEKFCSDYDRVHLTSQGYLKPCLCYEDGVNLRRILKKGQGRPEEKGHYRWSYTGCPSSEGFQRELRKVMEQATLCKPTAHCFERPGQITEAHDMIAIGG